MDYKLPSGYTDEIGYLSVCLCDHDKAHSNPSVTKMPLKSLIKKAVRFSLAAYIDENGVCQKLTEQKLKELLNGL